MERLLADRYVPRQYVASFDSKAEGRSVDVAHVRLFADTDGESHFGTAKVRLASTEFAPPAPPLEVAEISAARHGLLRAPPGWFGDWHPTPARQYMFLLSGVLEVSVSDGETRRMTPGDILLLEDTEGRGHATRVISDEPALLVFSQLR